MSYLYIDTTDFITIGLLDSEFKWLNYEFLESKKSSEVLHYKIFEMLNEKNLDIKNISGVIYAAGPGSYTGMRVSQGFVDILKLEGIPIYSFYHFEIPKMLNIKSGIWFSKAFKGETFQYSWSSEKSQIELIKTEEFLKLNLANPDLYSSHFQENFLVVETNKMLFESSHIIMKYLVENKMDKELYYYRELEDEFKK